MDVPTPKRSDLKKLITISLLIKKLAGAYSQLSEQTRAYLNSEHKATGSMLGNIEQQVDDSITELKKPEIENYNYQKHRKSAAFQHERANNKLKRKPKC